MRIALIILPLFVLAACQPKKEDMLAKKWKASEVDNPKQDSFLKEQEQFIDTFGRNNDAATNIKEYGFSNVDSARASLKAAFADYKNMQQHSVENTWFNFGNNGVVVMNFSGQQDSAKWYFDNEGKLIIDEPKLKGSGNTIKMEVIKLDDTTLKLKFIDNNGTSTVTFHPDKK